MLNFLFQRSINLNLGDVCWKQRNRNRQAKNINSWYIFSSLYYIIFMLSMIDL